MLQRVTDFIFVFYRELIKYTMAQKRLHRFKMNNNKKFKISEIIAYNLTPYLVVDIFKTKI